MICVFLAEGFEEIEALAFVDILRRADIDVKTVSIYDKNIVKGAHNIEVKTDLTINELNLNEISGVVLPGGIPGTPNLLNSDKVRSALEYAINNNLYVGAICAAPMILGKLGYLKGKSATSYPDFQKELDGANVLQTNVVKDGNIITSWGAGTAHDFAFEFVKSIKDEKLADSIRSAMQYSLWINQN